MLFNYSKFSVRTPLQNKKCKKQLEWYGQAQGVAHRSITTNKTDSINDEVIKSRNQLLLYNWQTMCRMTYAVSGWDGATWQPLHGTPRLQIDFNPNHKLVLSVYITTYRSTKNSSRHYSVCLVNIVDIHSMSMASIGHAYREFVITSITINNEYRTKYDRKRFAKLQYSNTSLRHFHVRILSNPMRNNGTRP